MGILILNGGMYTTIQDAGRTGYAHLGFSQSGVMDHKAFTLANMLLDNRPKEAVIEFSGIGPTLKILCNTFLAITGADFLPKINGKSVSLYQAIQVQKDDILSFSASKNGSFGYVSFAKGLQIAPVMGSCSTNVRYNLGGYKGRCLQKGDYIPLKEEVSYLPNFLSRTIDDTFLENYKSQKIRVILGPQEEAFTKEGIHTFLTKEYTLSAQCDRMGYRLEGETIEHSTLHADIISDGISYGAIQVPSHGKPIVMLSDRQTIGGYTKIAVVIEQDIPTLVQKRQKEAVFFQKISIEEANELKEKQEKEYECISTLIHKPCKEVLHPRSAAQRIATLF